MARSENNLQAVFRDTANAMRAKKESSNSISPRDFADEISSIPTGIEPTGTKYINSNGDNIDVAQYAKADVNVPSPISGLEYQDENHRCYATIHYDFNENSSGNFGPVIEVDVGNILSDEHDGLYSYNGGDGSLQPDSGVPDFYNILQDGLYLPIILPVDMSDVAISVTCHQFISRGEDVTREDVQTGLSSYYGDYHIVVKDALGNQLDDYLDVTQNMAIHS